jgi:uncharacterized protein (TIGR02145 family)
MKLMKCTVFAGALSAMAAGAGAEGIGLSGTVYDNFRRPLSGVVVSLAGTGEIDTTGADGTWVLGDPSLGAARRAFGKAGNPGALEVRNGRLQLQWQGRNGAGRSTGSMPAEAFVPSQPRAGRQLETQALGPQADTLVFEWKGKVRLRDTLWGRIAKGIDRELDSTVRADQIHGYLVDARDGQRYRTIAVGNQTWMAENLNYRVDSSWAYQGSADSASKYGRAYSWAAAMALPDSCNRVKCTVPTYVRQGACPAGWRIPYNEDWATLMTGLGGISVAGRKLKAKAFWPQEMQGSDSVGFRALPAPYRDNKTFMLEDWAGWWTGTMNTPPPTSPQIPSSSAYTVGSAVLADQSNYPRERGLSVRCIRTEEARMRQ